MKILFLRSCFLDPNDSIQLGCTFRTFSELAVNYLSELTDGLRLKAFVSLFQEPTNLGKLGPACGLDVPTRLHQIVEFFADVGLGFRSEQYGGELGTAVVTLGGAVHHLSICEMRVGRQSTQRQ